MEFKAESKFLTLKLAVDAKHAICRADKTRTMQILINLLSNAIKFSHDRGIIYITLMTRKTSDGLLSVKILVKD